MAWRDDTQPDRQRYECKPCGKRFDDLTGTVFEGHRQPLKTWTLCLYSMGLNLSNRQIALELGIHGDAAQQMTTQLREGIEEKTPVTLSGEVEFDEAYLVAGHKGRPAAVAAAGRLGRRRRLKGAPGRGALATEKPPVFWMIQRTGEVAIRLMANAQQASIQPIMQAVVMPGALVYTDEHAIYKRLTEWGYGRKTVNHGPGEYARDADGDGFHEAHVNTMEGFWSLLRSWLRPHRGVSQEKSPLYLSFFEFTHNARKRGKALLHSLVSRLVT